jgi:hypothetical protein
VALLYMIIGVLDAEALAGRGRRSRRVEHCAWAAAPARGEPHRQDGLGQNLAWVFLCGCGGA